MSTETMRRRGERIELEVDIGMGVRRQPPFNIASACRMLISLVCARCHPNSSSTAAIACTWFLGVRVCACQCTV